MGGHLGYLSVSVPGLVIDGECIRSLGRSVGQNLGHLLLRGVTLEPGFWSAIWSSLPSLKLFAVGQQVTGDVSPESLLSFCR
jgi:hypothetical protein